VNFRDDDGIPLEDLYLEFKAIHGILRASFG
jgi:hypothetical protein